VTVAKPEPKLSDAVGAVLRREYERAAKVVEGGGHKALIASLPKAIHSDIEQLGSKRHNGRGVVITLAACKIAKPAQDVRAHKAEHPGGFNARGIDTDVVVPLLRDCGLANAGESHWLTQVFSGLAFTPDQTLKTQPKAVGEIVPRLVCAINSARPAEIANALCALLVLLIEERNKGQVPLTKPKGLTIARAIRLLEDHFGGSFKSGGPRLPQLAVYSVYECFVRESKRYEGHSLVPLERLKTANRKSGTLGDVDVLLGKRTVEAVEIKFGMTADARHVSDAIEKIKTADVRRYYILATDGIKSGDEEEIAERVGAFYRSNGCEIIVNGIFETIRYYLRLVGSVDEFIARYVDHLASDDDLNYEHRTAWNDVCEQAVVGG
jgi:DNA (cytosine-5)-methyltransferase 1